MSKAESKDQKRKRKLKNRPSARAGKAQKAQEVQKPQPASTPNGKLIQDMMVKKEVKGTYKDYVLVAGARLIEWTDSWDIHNHGGETMGFEGVVLLHKSRLSGMLDENFASKFWNKKLRRRVSPKGVN